MNIYFYVDDYSDFISAIVDSIPNSPDKTPHTEFLASVMLEKQRIQQIQNKFLAATDDEVSFFRGWDWIQAVREDVSSDGTLSIKTPPIRHRYARASVLQLLQTDYYNTSFLTYLESMDETVLKTM